jgi:hypothetical protein
MVGQVGYRTVIIVAGMPMPALVSWMPMPSYDIQYNTQGLSGKSLKPVSYKIVGPPVPWTPLSQFII